MEVERGGYSWRIFGFFFLSNSLFIIHGSSRTVQPEYIINGATDLCHKAATSQPENNWWEIHGRRCFGSQYIFLFSAEDAF